VSQENVTKIVACDETGWSWCSDTWTLWLIPRKKFQDAANFLIFYLPLNGKDK